MNKRRPRIKEEQRNKEDCHKVVTLSKDKVTRGTKVVASNEATRARAPSNNLSFNNLKQRRKISKNDNIGEQVEKIYQVFKETAAAQKIFLTDLPPRRQVAALLRQYGFEQVKRYIQAIPWRSVREPVCFLFAALREQWPIPFPTPAECKALAKKCRERHPDGCEGLNGFREGQKPYFYCTYCEWFYNKPAPEEVEKEIF